MEKQCTVCEEYKSLDNYRYTNKTKGYLNSRCNDCDNKYKKEWARKENTKTRRWTKQWQVRNSEQYIRSQKLRNLKRKTLDKNIPFDLTLEQWDEALMKFNHKCPLTGSTDIVMDHFIPLDWNRGGTYIGNVYPLDKRLNELKHVKNPIAWLDSLNVDEDRKNFLIEYLAKENSLTREQFIDYVNWCDVSREMKTIDIWKSTQR